MVNDPNDIDRIFKDRFDGFRDHSIDPAAEWRKFESSLNAADGPFHASQKAGPSSYMRVLSSVTGVAAAGTAIIIVAGIFSGDSGVKVEQHQALTKNAPVISPAETPASAETKDDMQTAAAWPSAVEYQASPSTVTTVEASGMPNVAPAAGSEQRGVIIHPGNEVFSDLTTTRIGETTASAGGENAGYILPGSPEENESPSGQFGSFTGGENALALLPVLPLSSEQDAVLVERAPEAYQPGPITSWEKEYQVYVRGGVRIGNGESNTSAKPALWSLNGLASLGYGYALTDRSFLTIELGFLRRSGNSLERLKEVDFSPISSVVHPEYGASDGTSEPSLAVHESLITTRLNYLHLPASVHFMIDKKWNVSAGGFCDYLLWAQNESYRVFNSTSYVETLIEDEKEHTQAGLNKIRYGVTAGVEYTLNTRTVISFNGIIPMNNIMTEHSDYQINTRTNQLLDFHVGFRRQII